MTREDFVEFAGDDFAVVVAAAIHGLARLELAEAVIPSVRTGMISKGVNP